jgi:hypothetical protein
MKTIIKLKVPLEYLTDEFTFYKVPVSYSKLERGAESL